MTKMVMHVTNSTKFTLRSKKSYIRIISLAMAAVVAFSAVTVFRHSSVSALDRILFPLAGDGRFSNDFNAPRSDGPHHATDILAEKGRPVLAAMTGQITYVAYPEPSWGYMVSVVDDNGYKYNYIHLSNDTSGTNDNQGGGMAAYAPDVKRGNRIHRGQLLGYVGDSGYSNGVPHLHFEIIDPDGNPVNPYDYLKNAEKIYGPVPYPQLPNENLPYGQFTGGANIAMGQLNAQPGSEIVTAAGAGGGPHVKIYASNMQFSGLHFMAYEPAFSGGVDVALGDVDGDGIEEIITAPGPGRTPEVRVYDNSGTLVRSFMAYDQRFTGGLHVAAGDLDGDGVDEIVTGPGKGGGPNIRVFSGLGAVKASYFAYSPLFTGGVDVSSGDVEGNTNDELITAAGPGGGPHIRTWSYTGTASPTNLQNFFAYSPSFPGGVHVSTGDVTGDSKEEIVTIPRTNGGPHVRVFNSAGSVLRQKMYMEEWWYGLQDVVAKKDVVLLTNGGNRRTTIRQAY